jgi:hypothetical protein
MLAIILTIAFAQPPEALPVERYRWHDADTAVDAVVRLPYGILLEGTIRAADYDAWELGSRGGQSVDDAERQRGKKAVEELRGLTDGCTSSQCHQGRVTRSAGSWVVSTFEGRLVRLWTFGNGPWLTAIHGKAGDRVSLSDFVRGARNWMRRR